MSELAGELGCSWHTINSAVTAYGEALIDDDPDRIGTTATIGLDETRLCCTGWYRRQHWATSIVDVAGGRLLDVVEGRDSAGPSARLARRGPRWLAEITWVTLDLSGPYRTVFDTMLPDAVQIADPFHLIRLANQRLDEVRRRIQNQTLGAKHLGSEPSVDGVGRRLPQIDCPGDGPRNVAGRFGARPHPEGLGDPLAAGSQMPSAWNFTV